MRNTLLKYLVHLLLLLGGLTLLPHGTASRCSYLDYHSLCTFAPVSTLILWTLAWTFHSARVRGPQGLRDED